jgi:hypothetical protein
MTVPNRCVRSRPIPVEQPVIRTTRDISPRLTRASKVPDVSSSVSGCRTQIQQRPTAVAVPERKDGDNDLRFAQTEESVEEDPAWQHQQPSDTSATSCVEP